MFLLRVFIIGLLLFGGMKYNANAETLSQKSFDQKNTAIGFIACDEGLSSKGILYKAAFPGAQVYIKDHNISFIFLQEVSLTGRNKTETASSKSTEARKMEMTFDGALPFTDIIASIPTGAYINDYRHSFPTGDLRKPVYKKLSVKNLYPHIDMELTAGQTGLTYEFIVHPNGKVSDIKIRWAGVLKPFLSEGAVIVTNDKDTLSDGGLMGIQDKNKHVSINYNINDRYVSFVPGRYDHHKDLVIDPLLTWATYYGGSGLEGGNTSSKCDIAADMAGNVYMAYCTTSADSIATGGAFQSTYSGGTEVFVTKFSPAGKLLWGTYFGQGEDDGCEITTDSKGNIYIAGETKDSAGIATTGAHQSTHAGNYDAFLASFDSTGKLRWSTYLGGDAIDYGLGLKTDPGDHVYLAGWTFSKSGIATSGAFQSSYDANGEAFLARFTNTGKLQWSTYFGGQAQNEGLCLAVDRHSRAILGGLTNASGMATAGAYQTGYAGGFADAFVAQFDSTGSRTWSTYFGGSGYDYGTALSTDADNNIYASGFTSSTGNIATKGANQVVFAGGSSDVFLAKFSSTGSLAWATYYGGPGDEGCIGLSNDSCGFAYLTGYTQSDTGIATAAALQGTNKNHSTHAYLAKFNTSGSLTYGSYFEGNNIDRGNGIAIDRQKNIYISGQTISTSGISTAGAWQGTFGGNADAFLAKFTQPQPSITLGGIKHIPCQADTVSIGRAAIPGFSYAWTSQPKGFTSTQANPVVKPSQNTTYYITATPPDGCTITDSVVVFINHIIPPVKLQKHDSVCMGSAVTIGGAAQAGITYQWSSSPSGTGGQTPALLVSPSSSTVYFLQETDTATGCFITDTVTVAVHPLPAVFAGDDTAVCRGSAVRLGKTPAAGDKYLWTSIPAGPSFSIADPIVQPVINTKYILTEETQYGCTATDTALVTVNDLPVSPNLPVNMISCPGKEVQFGFSPAKGTVWHWSSLPAGYSGTDSIVKASPAITTQYILTESYTATGCAITDTATVTVIPPAISWLITRDTGRTIRYTMNDTGWADKTWYLGDSSKDTASPGYHSYSKNGDYKLQLQVTSKAGCQASKDTLLHINFLYPLDAFTVFPNPFLEGFTFKYILSKKENIHVEMYDNLARRIFDLIDAEQDAGAYIFPFEDRNYQLSPGVYYLRITAANNSRVFRLVKAN